ncbi:hypothetical protein CVS30_09480 [Arthrobacter psychrolactophilus]|uniref:HNH nuclease domain-containing protein n=1 Tax=Arthrobacter psychrolactophilus TaxID=92442 RepID=A0A2V5IWF5_9MICC|nr:HNH endonuclease signature motif containing protein [Arthrobacter psychrolactophilus]PYI38554.1 hypothetical protein CVS30_09480 [Arthrobacter psychrolactophilus]
MSSRECLPGNRGYIAIDEVAAWLASITFPTSIEPFGSDNVALDGLPGFLPASAVSGAATSPDSTPESAPEASSAPEPDAVALSAPAAVVAPRSRVEVARGVYDAAMAGLKQIKLLEDGLAACKAVLCDQVMSAAAVEGAALRLDAWQTGVSESSAVTNIALVLHVPEVTAAGLVHHSVELLKDRPSTFEALRSGVVSWRHATCVLTEIATAQASPGVDEKQIAGFEERLLALAVGTTAAGFTSRARRARESLFPDSLSARVKEAFLKRRVGSEPGLDGMSWMTFYLPSLAVESIMTRCTRIARAIMKDSRDKAVLMADSIQAPDRHADGQGNTGAAEGVEHRTLSQLKADVGAMLLMGQDIPANSYSNGPKLTINSQSDASAQKPSTAPYLAPWITPKPGDGVVGGLNADISGVDDVDNDDEPVWEHRISESFTASADSPDLLFVCESPVSPVVAEPPVSSSATELPGDGSGFVDGVIDGVIEDQNLEYFELLRSLRQGAVVEGPPLPRARVIVTVPFLGLLGMTEELGVTAGGGPVPADIARKLLVDAGSFVRVLTDPITGEVLPLAPERYVLRDVERDILQAIAGSCYYPGCTNPVMDTEFDHVVAFEKGGRTTMDNVRPTCRHHHYMRHFKDDKDKQGRYRRYDDPARDGITLRGWTPTITDDGRVSWVTPTGVFEPPLERIQEPPQYPRWLQKRIKKSLKKHKE